MIYDIGDQVRLSATFADPDTGVLTDPTAVSLRIVAPGDPDDGGTTVVPTNTAVGVYSYAYTTVEEGSHLAVFTASGTIVAVQWIGFTVRDSASEARGTSFPYGKQSWEPIV